MNIVQTNQSAYLGIHAMVESFLAHRDEVEANAAKPYAWPANGTRVFAGTTVPVVTITRTAYGRKLTTSHFVYR
jgi:hypothetical protein